MERALQTIRTSELFPNSWNTNVVSPDNQHKIEESIKRLGMFKPLICRTLEDGKIEILGGQHRWEAAKSLGIEQVPIVNLGIIDDKRAKEISLVDNSRYGTDDGLKLSELLRELDDISEYMPYSEAELNQIFNSAQVDLDALDFEETDDDLEQRVEELSRKSPTYQIMRFKVPLDDVPMVQGVIEGIIKKKGFSGSDSLTNAGDALVFLCGGEKNET